MYDTFYMIYMRRSRKFRQMGVKLNSDNVFFVLFFVCVFFSIFIKCLVDEGREDSDTTKSGPPSARQ